MENIPKIVTPKGTGSYVSYNSWPCQRFGWNVCSFWRFSIFPCKGWGPGFSLCCRPSALDRTLNLRARRICCMHFIMVFWRWGDFCMHVYRVCWIPLMGMSCFLVQNCTRITNVSCFSVHFCSRPSHISCFVRKFAYICVILCVCGALGGRQLLRRGDVCMQCYTVFWEPFIGMSCFYGVCWQADEVWLHFYKVC